ncbi:MAG: hypothetical protein H3Z53_03975 [archaeon]|nr:hypothetical protein [archaeon]
MKKICLGFEVHQPFRIRDGLNDDELSRALEEVIGRGYHGEELRSIIYNIIKRRCDELVRIAMNNPSFLKIIGG